MLAILTRKKELERSLSRAKLSARARGAKGKFRLTRGPLRWWLIVAGVLTVQFDPARYAIGTLVTAKWCRDYSPCRGEECQVARYAGHAFRGRTQTFSRAWKSNERSGSSVIRRCYMWPRRCMTVA